MRGHWLKRTRSHLFWDGFASPPLPHTALLVTTTAAWTAQPERSLMLSVLQDALTHHRQCKKIVCLQCRTDTQWARDTATTFLYAFQSICDVLGVDGDRLRPVFLTTA